VTVLRVARIGLSNLYRWIAICPNEYTAQAFHRTMIAQSGCLHTISSNHHFHFTVLASFSPPHTKSTNLAHCISYLQQNTATAHNDAT
jgi:hypothetical protein